MWHDFTRISAQRQKLLLHRAMCNSAASQGDYKEDLEKQPVSV